MKTLQKMRLGDSMPGRELAARLRWAVAMTWRKTVMDRAFRLGTELLRVAPLIDQHGTHCAHIGLQLFRSGTAVGAMLEEAEAATTRRDMAHKQSVALREAREAEHWLRMLIATNVMKQDLEPLRRECGELIAILTASVTKLRRDPNQP